MALEATSQAWQRAFSAARHLVAGRKATDRLARMEGARRFGVFIRIAGGGVAIDQATKVLALESLSGESRVPVLGDAFGLQLAFNAGAAFSVGDGVTWVVTLASVLGTAAISIAAWRTRSDVWLAVLALAWAGAVGNLADRLTRPPGLGVGHVVDFLAYGDLFIGNFADLFLGIAAVLGVVLAWRRRPGAAAPHPRHDPGSGPGLTRGTRPS